MSVRLLLIHWWDVVIITVLLSTLGNIGYFHLYRTCSRIQKSPKRQGIVEGVGILVDCSGLVVDGIHLEDSVCEVSTLPVVFMGMCRQDECRTALEDLGLVSVLCWIGMSIVT